ncbi:hypothetical protein GLOTRDRAFT_125113 [Gloeophyllum trabeum ATCC 11539]|uniref:F-box domain-containing protein n=1 Tax=Gloeophyllum trabeum (strain ATCC 11539 / FP-39264 / Madison 617) TaxID=670483 RepID=S7QHR0_GLOTA|nr:uncharacterized protein GLOTRDRAFT_125113 [Gloeophyllum trabeum ATCC 11539]EPQ58783.1 hypothetical protein GLOTRDRAFT_125113 [Gloeophyllum trabeum ATCC 11539]
MDTLPLELIQHILSDACQDAGKTAASLRLVCKSCCALVERYRFRSVAITNSAKASRFLEICRASPGGGCGIRHLFMILTEQAPKVGVGEAIIQIAAPTIETLTLRLGMSNGASIYHTILSTPFPRLTHLTFAHPERPRYPLVPNDTSLRVDPPCLFPDLRYLRLAFGWSPLLDTAHQGLALFVARASPSKLTHVRLSDVKLTVRQIYVLRDVLGLPLPDFYQYQELQERTPQLPSSVRQYTVGVDTSFYVDRIRLASEIWEKAESVRQEVEGSEGTRLVLIPECQSETGREAREKWMDVRAGKKNAEHDWSESGVVGVQGWVDALENARGRQFNC